ncbi:MAG: DNA-binding protein [Caldiserica bacterium]|nr:MAG: DNA-binding protein [Caldisericota bacterium]
MKYILNSAVVTTPGVYEYRLIDIEEARRWVKEGGWESTIGYVETAFALAQLVEKPIPVNRKLIRMKAGDEALVFRLTVRLPDFRTKGNVGTDFILKHCEIGLLKKISD